MNKPDNIRPFINEDGRITQLPRKHAAKLAVLKYLSEKFQPDCAYTEQQVNEICGQWHTFGDYFLLRRELVDNNLMGRERDGSKYWKIPTSPDD